MQSSLVRNYKKNGIIKVSSLINKKKADKIVSHINSIFCNILIEKKLIKSKINVFKNTHVLRKFKKMHKETFLNLKLKSIQKIPEIYEIGNSKKILNLLNKIGLKNPVYSTEPLIMMHHRSTNISNGGDYAPLHQDWRSIQGSLNCAVLWIPLVEIKKKMGSISYIQGSHKKGLLPTKKHSWFRQINKKHLNNHKTFKMKISKGDGFLFSSFLVHKSEKNNSKNIRISLQLRYNDLKDQNFIKRGYPCNYLHAVPGKKILRKDIPSNEELLKIYN